MNNRDLSLSIIFACFLQFYFTRLKSKKKIQNQTFSTNQVKFVCFLFVFVCLLFCGIVAEFRLEVRLEYVVVVRENQIENKSNQSIHVHVESYY